MIGIEQKEIENIPVLMISDTEKANKPLPVVVYSHGFTSAKEHNLTIAFLLAEKGFRVVLPDGLHHGDRYDGIDKLHLQLSFWDIVMTNVRELKVIKTYLEEHNLILNGRFGLAGTSMGGITTAAALTQYQWIKVGAVLMGSPKMVTYAKELVADMKKIGELPITDTEIKQIYDRLSTFDLSTNRETLNERPLMFWHGEEDSVVPFAHSEAFYQEVRRDYHNKGNIQFIPEKKRNHKVSRYAILETVHWFVKHL